MGKQKKMEQKKMEDFYYEVMYDIIQGRKNYKEKAMELSHLKGKILRLNSASCRWMMLDSGGNNRLYRGRTHPIHHK
jgi:hypothetical protein